MSREQSREKTAPAGQRYGLLTDSAIREDNTRDVSGAEWLNEEGRYQVVVCCEGRQYDLGAYDRAEEAAEVRRQVETSLREPVIRELIVNVLEVLEDG